MKIYFKIIDNCGSLWSSYYRIWRFGKWRHLITDESLSKNMKACADHAKINDYDNVKIKVEKTEWKI